jgi:archaellum component FlaC
MVDDLMKALPENLPLDIKRESLMSIMKVSNIEKDDLLNDAYKRMDALNTVLKDTVQTTEDIITRNDRSIKELEKRIEDLKNVTEKRIKFKEDQNTMIDYEVQKIINIVEFVKPKK